jgi:diadenosine tetraphosphate (Ap4A) HIT family hydrolase
LKKENIFLECMHILYSKDMKIYHRDIWEQIQPPDLGANGCVFCEPWLEKDYVIFETEHWRVMNNKYPILGLLEHIMAVPKKHIKLAYEIPTEVMAEYPKVEKFVSDFFEWKSYFTFMRESLQNRSLEHIHYHFLPGKMNYKHLEYILLEQGFTNQLDSE